MVDTWLLMSLPFVGGGGGANAVKRSRGTLTERYIVAEPEQPFLAGATPKGASPTSTLQN